MFSIVTGGPQSRGDAHRGVQEDARSFGSKLGAIRLLTKNDSSREAFMGFLQQRSKAELLSCYLGLEDIKRIQSEDQAYTRVCALVCRLELTDAFIYIDLANYSTTYPSLPLNFPFYLSSCQVQGRVRLSQGCDGRVEDDLWPALCDHSVGVPR